MTLSLCLEMLFPGLPFPERMRAASRLGYRAVEFWSWADKDLSAVRAVSGNLGLEIAAFSGNRQHTMANPRDRAAFVDEVNESLEVALTLGCRRLMLLTDRLLADGSAAPLPMDLSDDEKLASVIESMAAAVETAAGSGVTLLLEPLNTTLDHPGYWLTSSAVGTGIVCAVGSPQARLLYDAYHMSMMGEDASAAIRANAECIGYIHVADMPGRHEPGTGVIDYVRLAETLRSVGYAGGVGFEFSPLRASEAAARTALEYFSKG